MAEKLAGRQDTKGAKKGKSSQKEVLEKLPLDIDFGVVSEENERMAEGLSLDRTRYRNRLKNKKMILGEIKIEVFLAPLAS